MTVNTATSPFEDPILLQLPWAVWRSLPVLAVAGLGTALIVSVIGWLFGAAPALVPVLSVFGAAPGLAWSVDAVHRRLFGDRVQTTVRRRILVTAVAGMPPAILGTWSIVLAETANLTASWGLQILAVAAVLLASFMAAVAIIVIPLASMRADVGLDSIAIFAVIAVIRRPLAPVAALACAGALTWLGLTWFGGLLVLVAPVFCGLMVAATWSTMPAVGVELPRRAIGSSDHYSKSGDDE